MPDLHYATELTVDISGLTSPEQADEIQHLIESALGDYKPTVTVNVREYLAGDTR